MNTFYTRYNRTGEEAKEAGKELAFRRVSRGFSSAVVDQLEGERLELEVQIEELRDGIVDGNVGLINTLASSLLKLKDISNISVMLAEEKESFVGESK